MLTIVHGRPATGKTRNAEALKTLFGCDQIVDGWEPEYRRRRLVLSPFPRNPHLRSGDHTLLLTTASADACREVYPDAQVISIEMALLQLEQAAGVGSVPPIPFAIPAPDREGYVTCHRYEDGASQDWFLHAGARVSHASPQWAGGSILLHILGGAKQDPSFEEEGCALLLTTASLRLIGKHLIAIADRDGAAQMEEQEAAE